MLLEPFGYDYMVNAMWVSALVGCVCGFLSAYLMLKGWSLIGDALSHSIVPGVAGAYMLGLPFSAGAFLSGGLAAGAMLFLNHRTRLKEDAIIGMIFTSFFGVGLFMVSLSPTSVNIQTIVLGNILAITPSDTLQLAIIGGVTLLILLLKWKDLMVTFFDENHARSIGLKPLALKLLFFTLLAASTVAAMQTVGAFLVIAIMVAGSYSRSSKKPVKANASKGGEQLIKAIEEHNSKKTSGISGKLKGGLTGMMDNNRSDHPSRAADRGRLPVRKIPVFVARLSIAIRSPYRHLPRCARHPEAPGS